jgi:hypothetical protein
MKKGVATYVPRCPLCDRPVKPPQEAEPKRLGDFDYGGCECGAVFVHDVTGHNLGAAFVEALGFACADDWDLAWSLMPGADYEEAEIEGYDIRSNLVHPTGRTDEGNRVRGVLSFVRLTRDIREVTGPGVEARLTRGRPPQGPALPEKGDLPATGSRRYSKKEIEDRVASGDTRELLSMLQGDPLVLKKMQRLLYSADEALRWRAVTGIGEVAKGLASYRPAAVGELLRSLLYASNDSAATNWGSIETIGEIIRVLPDVYGSFLRHLLNLLNDVPSRPAVLWAVGRVGELNPGVVRSSAFFAVFDLLKDPDPRVRGHAVWALGRAHAREGLNAIEKMFADSGELSIFDGQEVRYTSVGDLAREAADGLMGDPLSRPKEENMSEGIGSQVDTEKDREYSEAVALYREAEMLSNRGMSLDALEKFERAMEVFEGAGRDAEVANTSEKLGDLHVRRGNLKRAMPMYQRAMAICEKEGDDVSTLLLVEKVIDLYRAANEHGKAMPYYMRALELAEGLRDSTRAAYYLTGMGDIYQTAGELQNAMDAYTLAHRIYRGMGSKERAEILEKGIAGLQEALAGTSD